MDTRPEIWLPIGVHPVIRKIRTSHLLSVIGRLKDGVTPGMAQAELNAFLENWNDRTGARGHVPTKRPAGDGDHDLQLQPLQNAIVGDAPRAVWMLQAAAALVLLIGCANLANLTLARSESRRREFALRRTLGASRGRLLRQTMTEGVLLSVAGGLGGVWLAYAGVQALIYAYPSSLPRTSQLGLDIPVLLFACVTSIATGLVFGLIPGERRHTRALATIIKEGGERTGGSGGRRRVRRALVIAEIALAMMLVTTAALLIRSVGNLTRVDAGFDRSRLVTFSMTLPRGVNYPGGRAAVYQRLLDSLRGLPGVQSATAMSDLPFQRFIQRYSTRVQRSPDPADETTELIDYYQFVMSNYFETLGLPIVAGRGFDAGDAASEDRVLIVNETLATRLWPGRNPVGQRLRPNLSASMGTSVNPWHTVIGIVRDVRDGGVDRAAGTQLYLLIDQPAPPIDGTARPWVATAPLTMNVVLRTTLSVETLSPTLARTVREADPAVPIVRLREIDAVFAESIRRPRLLAQLLSGFAALALLLATVGTYGVLAYTVSERRREIGLRMALGAARSAVIAQFMRQGLQATVIGVAIGVVGALAVGRLMESLLFGVRSNDPSTLLVVVVTMVAIASLACWLPAWRASRLDPSTVLRTD
jgi:predicted permease